METAEFVEIIVRIICEVVLPAVAVWLCFYIRKWLKGELPVPPHVHEITVKGDERH